MKPPDAKPVFGIEPDGYWPDGAALAEIEKLAGQELSLIGAENWLEEMGEACPA